MGAGLGEGAAAELLGVEAEGARWGEFRPIGRAPGTASELCSLPKPVRYSSASAVFLACSLMCCSCSVEGILWLTVGFLGSHVNGGPALGREIDGKDRKCGRKRQEGPRIRSKGDPKR